MLDSLSFIIAIIRSYWMMFLSFLGSVSLPKKPQPPVVENRLFSHSNETIHWMEISKTERYGTQLKHQWCDQETADDTSHYREFFSPKTAGSYFPNGEKKWFIGHHWRDFIHGGGLYFYNILMRRSMPAVYAYDLNSPSNTGMRAAYRKVCEQMNQIEQPKKAKKRFFKFTYSALDVAVVVLVVLALASAWLVTEPIRSDWVATEHPVRTENPVRHVVKHDPPATEEWQLPGPQYKEIAERSVATMPTQKPLQDNSAEVLRALNALAEQQATTNQQIQVIIAKQNQQEATINKLNRDRIRRNKR